MQGIQRAFGAFVMALALQGCVKVMHTKPVFDYHSNAAEMVKQSEVHHKKATEFYAGVRAASSTPDAPPYPAMKALLGRLNASYAPVRAFVERSWEKIRRFQALAANRSEIHSNWPEWEEALAIYEWYRAEHPVLKKSVDEINAVSQAFNAEADAHKVGFFETKQDREAMVKNVDGLQASVTNIRGEIARAEAEIQRHSAATLGLVKHKKLSEGLLRMKGILAQVESKVGPLKARLKAYLDTPGLPAIQYRGPGIKRVKALEDLEAVMEEVRVLVRQYNAEVELMKQK